MKAGDKWISPDERVRSRASRSKVADAVRLMLKEGRLKDSAALLLDRSLAADPQSVSLVYLKGVLQYRQDQLAPARKSFEAVVAQAADHAPTLNDLGGDPVAAERHCGRAEFLRAGDGGVPDSREILDNVAEALNALPADRARRRSR